MKSITLGITLLGYSLATEQVLYPREGNLKVPTVNTTSGMVSGHAAPNTTGVSEYLGIPFAQPPVGELRFAPPQPYKGNGHINGTKYGFTCPATSSRPVRAEGNITVPGAKLLTIIGQSELPLSEDCLTLNIWVPSGGEENKAVLLWVFGGGFSVGGSAVPFYNGQYFAEEQDVIIVTINYRINIFGFPGNPSERNANLGLLDQRLAVEWTRDNIAAFGGDPSRITMFGQSAGSASLEYFAYAWKKEPIIAGLIQQSGSITHEDPSPQDAKAVENSWFYVSEGLGCGDTSDHDAVVKCMRTKDVEDILAYVPGFTGTSNLTFGPVADEITIFSDIEERTKAGDFYQVPLLMGTVNYETGLTIALGLTDPGAVSHSQAYWDNVDEHSMCSVPERANISISHNAPTWRYRYFGVWPDMQLSTYPDCGAWHTIDVLAVFDYIPQGPGIPDQTPEQISTGKYVRGAWAAFAKDPKEGLKGYEDGWPLYNPTEDTLVRLAYNNQTGANLARPYQYDKGCNSTFPVNGSASQPKSTPFTGESSKLVAL
ncbi:uncharacterized protein APUU_51554A [Aspergillus puulaauensis]|uniref:Carboxylesterase type B domain-containing protein n=1 Tax=Aspergillus puulaauensis TaxID=1220207 RepID=A0A7R8ARF4_9EURO|nr:uncharacterized protein APUU_51554A [Aspergillus puulaauensis]BCS26843.1 hypothetical protein APUU_51554A [Aspergillus puulaauensis]